MRKINHGCQKEKGGPQPSGGPYRYCMRVEVNYRKKVFNLNVFNLIIELEITQK